MTSTPAGAARLRLDEYPWEQVERTKAFITGLFCGPSPDRPGAILHPPASAAPARPAPPGLDDHARAAWDALEAIRRRPVGGDDFVPTLGTGAGTCAMATAFGCEQIDRGGVHWVRPCIRQAGEIDRLRKPPVTAGALGGVLEQTRRLAEATDERLPVRVMDFQSPFTTVEQMLGSEAFFLMPYDEPVRLKALMDLVTDFAIEFFRPQLAAAGPRACPGIWPPLWYPPAAGIQMSDDNLVNVSPDVYEQFAVPYNERIAEAFGGLFLHSCTIREPYLPVLERMGGLTGLNCDVSSSVTVKRLLERFGERIVVAPHAYINTGNRFADHAAFVRSALDGWRPGLRLFIYPCTVMYQPQRHADLPFDEPAARKVLDELPTWRRDRPA